MAEVIKERVPARGSETVVVNDRETPRSNTGTVVAVVALIIILLIVLGGFRTFRSGGGGTNVNVTPSTNTGH